MGSQAMSDTDNHIVLSDFLANVPPALTLALVQLSPCISICKSVFQISSWSTSWYYSWLALASWWAVCLLLDRVLRTSLPFIILALVIFIQRRRKEDASQMLTTEQALQTVIADVTTIQTLFPSFPPLSVAPQTLLRVTVLVYVPYLALSYFLSSPVICGIIGTALLSYRAPWAKVLCSTLWRSAWLRWSAYRLWATLTGQPLPPLVLSSHPLAESTNSVQSMRFLFTIYENQRWWMALDWTAALLPGERPSWCSATQQPLSPPNAFVLPENTTVYLPDEKGGRIKRTATWRWEEPEWRVIVRKDPGNLSRVERPLPSLKDDSPNASRLLKAAGRIRDSSGINVTTSDSSKNAHGSSDIEHAADTSKEDPDDEPLTDTDGWVYGDNKWEGQSNRGGLGKYTRYRRWTRIAVVFEEVEHVSDGELGIHRETDNPEAQVVEIDAQSQSSDSSSLNPPDSPLRQRLRNALQKSSQAAS